MAHSKRQSDWSVVFLLPAAVVGMETLQLYPWLAWIGDWSVFASARPPLHVGSVIAVLVLGLVLTRRLLHRSRPLWLIRSAIILGGALVFAAVQQIEYGGRWTGLPLSRLVSSLIAGHAAIDAIRMLSLPVLIYLWWRGIRLGSRLHHTYNIQMVFAGGLLALVVLAAIRRIGSAATAAPYSGYLDGLYITAFFACGLLAITINHLQGVRGAMQGQDTAPVSIRRWLPFILGIIGGIITLVLATAAVFSERFLAAAAAILATGWQWSARGLFFLLTPIFYLFDGLFRIVRYLVQLLRGDLPDRPPDGGPLSVQDVFGDVAVKAMPPEVALALKWTLGIVVIGGVIWLLARSVARFRAGRDSESIEEIHESLWSWKEMRDDVRSLLARLVDKLRQAHPAQTAFPGFDPTLRRLEIREIFRRLQWLAARRGAPRRSSETAREFGYRLSGVWPGSNDILHGLTHQYHRVRYGEAALPEHETERANRQWQDLQGMLQSADARGPDSGARSKGPAQYYDD